MYLQLLLQIFLITGLTGVRGGPINSGQNCREPDVTYMNRIRRSLLEDFTYMSEAHVHSDEIIQSNHRSCPPRKLLSSTSDISLCPTYQVLDRDERRTPSNILQTRCRCDRCNMRKRKRYQYKCTPVFRYIPVLMQTGCTNGVYDYMVAEEKVSVVCVCTESLKSKKSQRTESSTSQRREYSLSDDTGNIPDIDKMSVNFGTIKPPQSSQGRNSPSIIDFRRMENEEVEEEDDEENEEVEEEDDKENEEVEENDDKENEEVEENDDEENEEVEDDNEENEEEEEEDDEENEEVEEEDDEEENEEVEDDEEENEEVEDDDDEENEEVEEGEKEEDEEEETQQHQTKERLSDSEKMPSVIESFDDTAVEASDELLPKIQHQDTEKMPNIPQPRDNIFAATTQPNEAAISTNPAKRVSTEQALTVPGNVKMPIAFGQSHDYYSNERMPE